MCPLSEMSRKSNRGLILTQKPQLGREHLKRSLLVLTSADAKRKLKMSKGLRSAESLTKQGINISDGFLIHCRTNIELEKSVQCSKPQEFNIKGGQNWQNLSSKHFVGPQHRSQSLCHCQNSLCHFGSQGTFYCGILVSGIGGSGDPRRKWEEMGEREKEREC